MFQMHANSEGTDALAKWILNIHIVHESLPVIGSTQRADAVAVNSHTCVGCFVAKLQPRAAHTLQPWL